MLMPARASDSGRNAPKTLSSGRHGHLYSGNSLNINEKNCCDGFGKVLSDDQVN